MNASDLVDRYIATWNETDPARRRDLIARTWSETATYVDPMLEGEGPSGIDAMIAAVQQRFPGHRFRAMGPVDAHHDRMLWSWELESDSGASVASGTDFGVIADGKLAAVTGFFDRLPQS